MAACIKAETGVGPSMASGNHVCKPIWADFPTAPINKNKHIKFKLSNWNWKNSESDLEIKHLKIVQKH